MSALSKRSRAAAIPLLWIFLLCARVHAALAADGGCDVARVNPFSSETFLRSSDPHPALLKLLA